MNSTRKFNTPRLAVLTALMALILANVLACSKTGSHPAAPNNAKPALRSLAADSQSAPGATGRAPFIIQDTVCDSPGTNLVSRLVMFSAVIDGGYAVYSHWMANKGNGFVDLNPPQTNQTFWITNAQVCDSGSYALFSTNSFGSTNSTPVEIVIVEGTD